MSKTSAVIIVFVILAAILGVIWVKFTPKENGVACTLEAMECPDGSYVGRVAPTCEFAKCPNSSAIGMPNPASVNCEARGGRVDIREEVGGQVGYCLFPNGKECEEWAFFRNECNQ